MRVRIVLTYSGAHFHGWANQPGLRTVQNELESVLSTILREPVELTVAGRTDAGVHARNQVAHFDISYPAWTSLPGRSTRSPGQSLVMRANSLLARAAAIALPELNFPRGYSDVVVRSAEEVPAEFDARFSALWREYSYRIADGIRRWDPRLTDTLWLSEELDVEAMNTAAQDLLGEHDFLSFCKPRDGASTVRTLQRLYFERVDDVLIGHARADAFCHSQVRTLMGTLIEVGRGARPISWPAARLAARNRDGEVVVAPPHPLTLEQVGYPVAEHYETQAIAARRYRGVVDSDNT